MAPARPSLLERLQQQVAKLEREGDYLRKVDKTMQERLRMAVAQAEKATKAHEALSATVLDLRRQVDARTLELQLVRAELDAEKLARPVPLALPEKTISPVGEDARFGRIEVD